MTEEFPQDDIDRAQVVEWAALQAELSGLRMQLINMTSQRDDAVAALLAAGQAHDFAQEEWRKEFNRHLQRANEASHNATRERNRLELLARHLMPIVVDWLDKLSALTDEALVPLVRQRRRDAADMVRLMLEITK